MIGIRISLDSPINLFFCESAAYRMKIYAFIQKQVAGREYQPI